MAVKGFLYGQTEYNLLKNTIHLEDYIAYAQKNNFTFLSITDRNMYGCYKFYQACLKAQLKPIIGLEISYIEEDNQPAKVLAYALNNQGYRSLLKLSTYLNSNPEPQELDFLEPFHKDIALVIVYNESVLERLLYSKAYEEVERKLATYQKCSNLFIGYSFTNRLDRLNSNQEIQSLCQRQGVPFLPIHQCCYLTNKDTIVYEALMKIGGQTVQVTDFEDYSFDCNPIENEVLQKLVAQIHLDLYHEKVALPHFPHTKGVSSKDYLYALCQKGLEKRLSHRVSVSYRERLKYELEVIHRMGYEDYFLIVWDFILYAKKKQILVGPGRGSAAGSLVAYCLGITEIDPLRYDLLFERFLNPERISMPDIDTDFPDNYRDEVIQYVQSVYGKKHVCNISAFNTFLLKSSIRDLGRVMKIQNDRLEEIIRLVESAKDYDLLLEQFKERKDIYEFLYIIKRLENLPRHISTHAAGIIIAEEELDDIIPLQEGINGLCQSQFEAVDLERIGLLKMDFLGIRNLSIVDEVMKKIPNFGIQNLRQIPLNDKKTYQLLQNADTLGVFQLESDGVRRVLQSLKPVQFDDLVAVLALYRPGPMDNIDEFISRRHGKPFQYLHPVLEPILKGTYGIIVYQEQIMKIAQAFAGFSLGEADLLRRAISKKNEDKLRELQEQFIVQSIQKGYSESVANTVYQYILKFANYGFNKSHSVAYALLTYQMAYLKANYFNIFISKILNNVIGATKTMVSYIHYAKQRGVPTFKPDINVSSTVFEVTKKGMVMPLQAIHSIGETIAKQIVEERRKGLFQSFVEFKERCPFVNTNVIEALIYAGAFDRFQKTKKSLIESKENYNEIFSRHLDDQIEDVSEYDFSFLQQKEYEYLGFNITYNVFIDIEQKMKRNRCVPLRLAKARGFFSSIVVFDKTKQIKTKKQELMMMGTVRDAEQALDFVLFPNEFKLASSKIELNRLLIIDYMLEVDSKNQKPKIILKNVKNLN